MPEKPKTAEGYSREQVELVRAACLYVATKLGDLSSEVIIVGGLVPSLLIDQAALAEDAEPHVGTMDLDLGLKLTVFNSRRYQELAERLRSAGFEMDTNERGNVTRQRWKIDRDHQKATVDFLIPPSLDDDRPGDLRDLEHDFAAVIAPGLALAFRDYRRVCLEGKTIKGEDARRDIHVCGPAAYVLMKALAFKKRGENKDAYDLFYVIQQLRPESDELGPVIRQLRDDDATLEALEIMKIDFTGHDSVGPKRVAEFTGASDDQKRADVVGDVLELLRRCGEEKG